MLITAVEIRMLSKRNVPLDLVGFKNTFLTTLSATASIITATSGTCWYVAQVDESQLAPYRLYHARATRRGIATY